MKANKRIRDLRRRSNRRLTFAGGALGTTTYPLTARFKDGKQRPVPGIEVQWR